MYIFAVIRFFISVLFIIISYVLLLLFFCLIWCIVSYYIRHFLRADSSKNRSSPGAEIGKCQRFTAWNVGQVPAALYYLEIDSRISRRLWVCSGEGRNMRRSTFGCWRVQVSKLETNVAMEREDWLTPPRSHLSAGQVITFNMIL